MDYVLGLDLGTSGLKGIVANRLGKIVGSATAEYPLYTLSEGFSEQNPKDWISALQSVIKDLKNTIPDFKKNLSGISFSGQMHSLVLLDDQDEVIRPAILWNDVRTTKQCQEIVKSAGDMILQRTKNRVLEGFTFPKLLWVKENEPENFKHIQQFLLPKDYLSFYLTGRKCMDYSDAAGTLLFDIKEKAWIKELVEPFSLPISIFPDLVESGSFIGNIKKSTADELGLCEGVKIFAGGADNACSALGAGIATDDVAMVSIGTSGVFLSYEKSAKNDYEGRLHYFNHVLKDRYYTMGVTLAAGQSLSWFRKTFAPDKSFETLLEGVNDIPAGSHGLIFTPYIMGERTPYFDSSIRGSFTKIDVSHTFNDFCRAVLEGITFSLKDSQILMVESSGRTFEKIVSIGGGAKNKDWLQMQANIFNAEIITLKSEGGAAIGALMLAAMGLNWYENVNDCIEAFVQYNKESYLPEKKQVDIYKRYYKEYQKVYKATKV